MFLVRHSAVVHVPLNAALIISLVNKNHQSIILQTSVLVSGYLNRSEFPMQFVS